MMRWRGGSTDLHEKLLLFQELRMFGEVGIGDIELRHLPLIICVGSKESEGADAKDLDESCKRRVHSQYLLATAWEPFSSSCCQKNLTLLM
jgi:hypothetical protein